MSETRRVRVFLNAGSGMGQATPEGICKLFAVHQCACEVTTLSRELDLPALAASDPPATVWVAAGGDGTINCIAHAIGGTGRLMGVLPVGTLNHFAQDLKIPLGLSEAVAVAATCSAKVVDAAKVNGFTFVNNSSLGVYPAMVLDRERMKKGGANKWGSLVLASARSFLRFRCLSVEVEIDGAVRYYKTPLLFVGNNVYSMDRGKLGTRERVDEGLLALYLVPSATRFAMFRLLIAALFNRVKAARDLEEFTVTSFTVRGSRRRRLRVSFDGEVRRMRAPLHYSTCPKLLQVIVPQ